MKPKVAFFDFTGCEGCQLDALNLTGEELLHLIDAIDIVNFREVMTERDDNYDIAFIGRFSIIFRHGYSVFLLKVLTTFLLNVTDPDILRCTQSLV